MAFKVYQQCKCSWHWFLVAISSLANTLVWEVSRKCSHIHELWASRVLKELETFELLPSLKIYISIVTLFFFIQFTTHFHVDTFFICISFRFILSRIFHLFLEFKLYTLKLNGRNGGWHEYWEYHSGKVTRDYLPQIKCNFIFRLKTPTHQIDTTVRYILRMNERGNQFTYTPLTPL